MNADSPRRARRERLGTTPPSAALESAPNLKGLQRRQTAVIRDLIRLDLATPRFETEGRALIRSLLEED